MDLKKANMLIVLCVVVSLFYWFVNPGFVDRFLVFSGDYFLKGWVWTPLTALFVHADLAHLLGNMLFLYAFGNTLEDELGARKMAAAFFIGGAFSFVLSVPFYGGDAGMVGASAAIFTLTAAVMLTKPLKFSWFFLMPLGLVAVIYFLYNSVVVYLMLQGAITQSNVGYVSHVIGFAIGFPFGMAWSRRWARNLLITVVLLIGYIILTLVLGFFLGWVLI